ncbi:methyltransferase family protein [Occallatibacter riparius]|uniref:Isoprenylcysteine carboxylmethyltransferase family protein n=1 Tax=Occallatibacter riparius TaxID=1002689 RepID=A0A9J7BSP0_9BACT|nr:isoprenylcysteine carboxylmethyltransferase family protein [Occallatibacter riparius]UWZ85892.1 isoprenylcysteine carboxylmethyltransferase family protein [Occallatibacter riparius]
MGATALEFRLRMVVNVAIIVLGVWAPWVPVERRQYILEWLPREVTRAGLMPFSTAVTTTLIIAGLLAALGAILRVWGTASLGPATVTSLDMKSGPVVASGPYRYVRNPLYLGLWFMVAAIALLMQPSGAALAMPLLTLFVLRLTLGEEAFLSGRLGEPYRAYLRAVPRFLPRLRNNLPPSESTSQWGTAFLSELTPIGVLVGIVVFASTYNSGVMARIILIGWGASLIARAFLPRPQSESTSSA